MTPSARLRRPVAGGLAALMLVAVSSCSDATSTKPTSAAVPTPSASQTEQTSAEAGTPEFEPEKLTWGRCKSKDLAKLKCATLKVPLDYADPTGTMITIALSMVPHRGKTSQGVLFSNPGGPGLSGLSLADSLANFDKVMRTYDLVGLDPRGVGASKPTLNCSKTFGASLPPLSSDQAGIDALQSHGEQYSKACANSANAMLLPHLSTENVVADFESARKALGVEQVSYWGNSYGSYVGQVYATLHPDRLERILLDGVVSPDLDWASMVWAQTAALEANLPRFYAYLAQHPQDYHLGTDPQTIANKVQKLWDQLPTKPLADGAFGQRQLALSLNMAAYGVTFWPAIGGGLDLLLNKQDARGLMNEPMTGNALSSYLGVICHESRWPDFDGFVDNARQAATSAPLFAWPEAWLDVPCVTWPADPVDPVTIDGSALKAPMLLYGETYDGATPYSGALATRALFPSSALIEGKDGTTHTAAIGSTGCTKQAIVKFWTDGTLPERKPGDGADVVCPPATVTSTP